MGLKLPSIPGMIYPVSGTVTDHVLVHTSENRAEQRQAKWSQPYFSFPLKCKPVKDDFLRLWEFYQLCRGPYKAFTFDNPYDLWAPLKVVNAYWPLHEAESTIANDRHGYINPTYSCRFADEKLSYDQMSFLLLSTGLEIVQEAPISFTNLYGVISGAVWGECPDGSACVDFDGSNDSISMGDQPDLDVGTGDFSIAFAICADSLAAQGGILSKLATL